MAENPPSPTEKKTKEVVEKAAEKLQIPLPTGRGPLILKLIALLNLAGGLGITGSVLADVATTEMVNIVVYLVRLLVGLLAIAVAYGIIQKKLWSPWLYAGVVLIGLFTNPLLAIVPAIVTIYIFTQRDYFGLPPFKEQVARIQRWIKNLFSSKGL
ncbi:MAG: hypothetical protein HYT03_00820 [Candidatus Harrisonbacteria bacterium]|nr:hypothetical protein [Candidatus Harrisonbacteria bacterium]